MIGRHGSINCYLTGASSMLRVWVCESHPLIHWYNDDDDVAMSEQVQLIVEAVRSLTPEQRRELMEALATVQTSRTAVSAGRRELVQAIKGKYREIPTSSESFMSRKREDLALESRS